MVDNSFGLGTGPRHPDDLVMLPSRRSIVERRPYHEIKMGPTWNEAIPARTVRWAMKLCRCLWPGKRGRTGRSPANISAHRRGTYRGSLLSVYPASHPMVNASVFLPVRLICCLVRTVRPLHVLFFVWLSLHLKCTHTHNNLKGTCARSLPVLHACHSDMTCSVRNWPSDSFPILPDRSLASTPIWSGLRRRRTFGRSKGRSLKPVLPAGNTARSMRWPVG